MIDWSAFWGAFIGTLVNIVEVIMLTKIIKSLREFKGEGEDKKWLK